MTDIGNPQKTIEIIQKHNFKVQKKYGQNFLIDPRVLGKITDAAELTKEDLVIEIGPGIGTMTRKLCEEAAYVVAIEIDRELIPILNETLHEYDNVEIINEDVLKVDLKKLIKDKGRGKAAKIVANLPYYITTPIIMSLLEQHIPIESITVMIQKEVADRMQTGPGSKDYGALSLAVQYYAKPYIVANVPPNCFIPRPKVGSAVIKLTCHKNPPVEVKDEKLLFKLIRASFNQRRKTLVNGVSNYTGLDYSKDEIAAALSDLDLAEDIRGEALTLAQFAGLSNRLASLT